VEFIKKVNLEKGKDVKIDDKLTLDKTECEKMFELNLKEARKAVENIFESKEKVKCDSAKNVLIDMAYFMGKKELG
jgi:GH24 family phage-related lysozyme (muramidase)